MSLESKIGSDIKSAMLSKDKVRLEALRAIKSAILIEKTKTGKKDEIEDDLLVKIIAKLNKQRIDAYDIYKEQNREDLAEEELLQSNIYKEYLPKPVSDEELKAQINSIISNLGASGMKDMGRVMGVAMKNLGGKADGSKISFLVKALLS